MVNRWGKQEKSALRTVIFIWEAGKMNDPLIREIQVKSVITKSNLPVCEYSVNPYVGCTPVSYTHLDVYKRQPMRRERNWHPPWRGRRLWKPSVKSSFIR